jgi:hypothetical protein
MKKIFVLSSAIVLSITAISFRPVFDHKENLTTNVLDNARNSKLTVNAVNHIFIPPSASEGVPVVLQICFLYGEGVESFLQRSISYDIKSIVQDIDMRNLDN